MNDDATRAAEDYDAMGPAYADDVRTHPINAAYERPAMLAMALYERISAGPWFLFIRAVKRNSVMPEQASG